MSLPYLSVIIPTYNEARRLPETLRAVHAYLQKNAARFEIIVVDDGSGDGTPALAKQLAEQLSSTRVLARDRNLGKGASVQEGLRAAHGDYLVYMDADHSTDISELDTLPSLIKRGMDVGVSSRYVAGSSVTVRQPWLRVLVSRIANFVIRIFAVRGIHDTQNGFKILRAEVAHAVLPHLLLRRWAFDVELLYVARRMGYRLIEFPVTWHNVAGSKLNVGRDIRNTAGEFVRFIWNRITRRYPRGPRSGVLPV